MAISLLNIYGAGRVVVDGSHPRGTFKDSTLPAALDGTPLQYAWSRDIWAFLEIMLNQAGIVPNDVVDTPISSQRYEALKKIVRSVIPAWESVYDYAQGDTALYNSELYQSILSPNVNHQPDISPSFWKKILTEASSDNSGIVYLAQKSTVSNNGIVQIDFGAGNFVFDDKSGMGKVPAYTKNISQNWIAGNGGGLDTGTVAANTWYDCYQIYNPTAQAGDFIFCVAGVLPLLPAGYTKKKLLTSIRTNSSSTIVQMTWKVLSDRVEVFYNPAFTDLNISTQVNTYTNLLLTVPPRRVKIWANVTLGQDTGFGVFRLRNDEITDFSPLSFNQPGTWQNSFQFYTKNDGTVDYQRNFGGGVLTTSLATFGFTDNI